MKKALSTDLILRQIRVNRFQNGEVNRLLSLLESANKQIKKEILLTKAVESKARYRELSVQLNEISRKLKENIALELDNPEFIDEELNAMEKILRKNGLANYTTPNANTIRTAVQFTPFANTANYESFLNAIQEGFYNVWDNALRTGYMTGETTQKIVRNVMGAVAKNAQVADRGLMARIRDSVERNTRTYLQSMATVTRERVFLANASYFKGYQWVSTLDRRTCIVCGELDGKLEQNIKDFDQPPLHYNCRCLILPVVKGMDEIETTRASENGQVDSKMDFESWLKEQPEEVQKEVLGKTRYDMYIKTGQKIGQFVADNQILTIAELRKLY